MHLKSPEGIKSQQVEVCHLCLIKGAIFFSNLLSLQLVGTVTALLLNIGKSCCVMCELENISFTFTRNCQICDVLHCLIQNPTEEELIVLVKDNSPLDCAIFVNMVPRNPNDI